MPRLLAVVLAACAVTPAQAQQGNAIPLCPGLTIVSAVSRPEGDYESINTVTAASETGFTIAYSAQIPTRHGSIRHWKMRRVVLRADLGTAPLYAHYYHTNGSLTIPGSTALGVSTAVLRSLKRTGAAELGLIAEANHGYPADRSKVPNLYDYEETWKLRRIGSGTVPLRVTVNDTMVTLPAIHAQGSLAGDRVDFAFLDDEENPLALYYRFASGGAVLKEARIVKMSYRCTGPTRTAGDERIARLERALREQRRAVVYDLYFDFNSDIIREESKPTLHEIAEVIRRNPDWKLSIEGHTDDVASDRYNLELSSRRAAAVKAALGTQFSIAGSRLSTAGFGESRAQDRNDTVEGRARNRRVELVRQ